MKEGKLVPSGVTVRLLRAAMLRSSSAKFLIDGFPRAIDQVQDISRSLLCRDMLLVFRDSSVCYVLSWSITFYRAETCTTVIS